NNLDCRPGYEVLDQELGLLLVTYIRPVSCIYGLPVEAFQLSQVIVKQCVVSTSIAIADCPIATQICQGGNPAHQMDDGALTPWRPPGFAAINGVKHNRGGAVIERHKLTDKGLSVAAVDFNLLQPPPLNMVVANIRVG